jgi:hypothetical protein
MVLCLRCYQVVPDDAFCNQCGQNLGGTAVPLRQVAQVGDASGVTSGETEAPVSEESGQLQPDEPVELAEARPPDLVQEPAPQPAPPPVEAHIYPALRPLQTTEQSTGGQSWYLIVVILLAVLVLVAVVAVAVLYLLRGGG